MIKIKILIVAFFYSGTVFAQNIDTNNLTKCLEVGLKADIGNQKYDQMLRTLLTSSRKEKIWIEEYGADNLSFFLLYHEPYESRVFAIDYLDQKNDRKGPSLLYRSHSKGRHICEISDIKSLDIIQVEEINTKEVLVVGRIVVERASAYRVNCSFVARGRTNGENYRLEYLGVENRLTQKIRYARTVFVWSPGWREVGRILRSLTKSERWVDRDTAEKEGKSVQGKSVSPIK